MQAVILAGGEGQRVRPLTHSQPKVMIPVANRPILDYVIESVEKCGINDIIVVAGYRKEQVIRYLNSLDTGVSVVVQKKQLGVFDALRCAKDLIKGNFLLIPGDNYIDSESLSRLKAERNAMLTAEHPYPSNYGVVSVSGGMVKGISEKPALAESMTVSTGCFSLTPDIFNYPATCMIPDIITDMAKNGRPIRAVPANRWHDAIYAWDLLKMNRMALEMVKPSISGNVSKSASITGHVSIGSGTVISPYAVVSGDVVIGENSYIGPHTCIMPGTSIGSRVRVEPFTYVENAILMDDSSVGSHCRITDSVIAKGAKLGSNVAVEPSYSAVEVDGHFFKAFFGSVVGDNSTVAPFTVLKHCVIGNSSAVENGRIIEGFLPDGSIVR